jgi:uncharacterized membrane protein
VTTFKVVPRGTEGAVSIEGTLAGILASVFLASVGYLLGQVYVFRLKLGTIRSFLVCLTEICLAYSCQ